MFFGKLQASWKKKQPSLIVHNLAVVKLTELNF